MACILMTKGCMVLFIKVLPYSRTSIQKNLSRICPKMIMLSVINSGVSYQTGGVCFVAYLSQYAFHMTIMIANIGYVLSSTMGIFVQWIFSLGSKKTRFGNYLVSTSI